MCNDGRKDSWGPRPGGAGDRARKRPSYKVQAAAAAAAKPARQQQLVSSYNLAWADLYAYLRELWPDEEFVECCRNEKFVLNLPEPLTEVRNDSRKGVSRNLEAGDCASEWVHGTQSSDRFECIGANRQGLGTPQITARRGRRKRVRGREVCACLPQLRAGVQARGSQWNSREPRLISQGLEGHESAARITLGFSQGFRKLASSIYPMQSQSTIAISKSLPSCPFLISPPCDTHLACITPA